MKILLLVVRLPVFVFIASSFALNAFGPVGAIAATQKSETKKEKRSSFSMSTSLGVFRGLDKDATIGASATLGPSYSIDQNWSLYSSITFYNYFTKYETEAVNYVFDDTIVGVSHGSIATNKKEKWNLSGHLQVTIPTSKTSQNASLRNSISPGISFSKGVGSLTASLSSSFYLYNHEFTTADQAGFIQNEVLAFLNGLSASYSLTDSWSIGTTASMYNGLNYADNWVSVYSVGGSTSYQISKKVGTSLSLNSKDITISNNSMFDQENSTLSLGVSLIL